MQKLSQIVNTNSQIPQQTAPYSASQQPPVQHNGVYMPVHIPQVEEGKQCPPVNIIVYNPSVNPAAGTIANSNNTYSTPPATVVPYPVLYANNARANASAAVNLNGANNNNQNKQMAYPANYYTQDPKKTNANDVEKSYISNTSVKDTVKTKEAKKEKETHKEKIVQLTDEYIKTLENYMNNPNPKVREMAIKEIMERFKEHKSRYTDIALTNLLNKALQDKAKTVRFVALATLDSEFARGDDFTVDILNKMQSSSNVYGEDALLAADILLKMSRRQVEVTVPGPKPETKKAK